MQPVNPIVATDHIIHCLKANLVPMVHGSPGIGKSDVIKQVAEHFKLFLIDKRLSQCDPTDLQGFPTMNEDRTRSGYAPMDTFPLENDEIPPGYNGFLLFLDEINSASKAVQAAAYKVVLDREIGKFKLHPKARIVCAGNMAGDNAIVNQMSSALKSRMIHIHMDVDRECWTDWASSAGIDHRIPAFINFKPSLLHDFRPDSPEMTFPCPRTWEFASRLIKGTQDIRSLAGILGGTISEGATAEFIAFCENYNALPKIDELIRNPDKIEMPTEPGTLYALCGAIGSHADTNNIAPLMTFVNRMPIEFQVITLRDITRRDTTKTIKKSKPVIEWIKRSARELV